MLPYLPTFFAAFVSLAGLLRLAFIVAYSRSNHFYCRSRYGQRSKQLTWSDVNAVPARNVGLCWGRGRVIATLPDVLIAPQSVPRRKSEMAIGERR